MRSILGILPLTIGILSMSAQALTDRSAHQDKGIYYSSLLDCSLHHSQNVELNCDGTTFIINYNLAKVNGGEALFRAWPVSPNPSDGFTLALYDPKTGEKISPFYACAIVNGELANVSSCGAAKPTVPASKEVTAEGFGYLCFTSANCVGQGRFVNFLNLCGLGTRSYETTASPACHNLQ